MTKRFFCEYYVMNYIEQEMFDGSDVSSVHCGDSDKCYKHVVYFVLHHSPSTHIRMFILELSPQYPYF